MSRWQLILNHPPGISVYSKVTGWKPEILPKINPTQVFFKRLCLDPSLFTIKFKILRTILYSCCYKKIRAKKNKKNIRENSNNNNKKPLMDFPPNPPHFSIWPFTCSLLVLTVKTYFVHIHLGYWDFIICCMPFAFESYCLFWVTCSNFFSIFLHFWFQEWGYWYIWTVFLWIY